MRFLKSVLVLIGSLVLGSHSVMDDFTLWDDIGLPDDLVAPETAEELARILVDDGSLNPARSLRNRVIALPVSDEVSFPGALIRERVVAQRLADETNDAFTPDLSNDNRFENTPLGRITLGQVIRQSISHVDFTILEHPSLLIRYSHDCTGMPFTYELHPLLKDFSFGTIAQQQGIGPAYFFVSPPAPVPLTRIRKLAFPFDDETYAACFFAEGTVRYALIEQTQMSLRSYINSEPGGRMDFWYAMQLGRTLIEMIRAFHSRGVVHGDVALEHLRVDRIEGSDSEVSLSLSGFRYASESGPDGLAIDPVAKDLKHLWSIGFSPRELAGLRYGKQDDVFRIVETVAAITQNITEYRSELMHKFGNGTLSLWKSHGFLFGDLRDVDPSVIDQVRVRLNSLLELARSEDPEPRYDDIFRLFSEVSAMTAPPTVESTSSPSPPLVLTSIIAALDNVQLASPPHTTIQSPTNQENRRPSKKRSRDPPTL